MPIRISLLFGLLLISLALPAGELFSSGERRVSLLELYTSQGCSSCPPTERWLNRFTSDERLWSSLVPVTFHVDYWNYLGWDDPYSDPAYSQRQRQYRRLGRVGSVYTPGLLLNGKEWRPWVSRDLQLPDEAAPRLEVRVDGQQVDIDFDAGNATEAAIEAKVALLGFGIESEIAAGENRGRTLEQEFVVLGLKRAVLRDGVWHGQLPTSVGKAKRYALAVWISRAGSQGPLQATGGWLKGGI